MTVCMFPGQGSQARGMGKDLFDRFAELTQTASDILGYSIAELCLDDPRKELNNTRFTQPALYVVNALSWRQRQAHGNLPPAFLMGHSLGEYNALEAAGALGFADGLRLVQQRGALMAEVPPGAMAAVIGMPEDRIREALAANGLEAIDIANLNAPDQIILSGLRDDIQRAAPVFESEIVRYVPLNTSGAFHSRYMAEAAEAFEAELAAVNFGACDIPVIANVTAEHYPAEGIADILAAQITQPVQWAKSVLALLAHGEHEFEELGPGQVLTRLVANIQKSAPAPTPEPAPKPIPEPTPAAPTGAYDRATELAALQQRIDDWNRKHPLGSQVLVEGYDGPLVTRTKAMALFGHRAAIYLEGYNGYFELSDLRPA
jgi:malonyl CoA-acyl carrier protein transacylase